MLYRNVQLKSNRSLTNNKAAEKLKEQYFVNSVTDNQFLTFHEIASLRVKLSFHKLKVKPLGALRRND